MEKSTREDWETGYYTHGKPEYHGGIWRRPDTWNGNNGVNCLQSVCANGEDDDSNIYRGKCVYACTCCYLNLLHTEEYHRSQTAQNL